MINAFRQVLMVILTSLHTLPRRAGTAIVIVVGVAAVVAVLTAVLAMGTGLLQAVADVGREDRAIVLRSGASTEATSLLMRDEVAGILDAAGIKHDVQGRAVASAESLAAVTLREKKAAGDEVTVGLRGVGTEMLQVRPEIRIVQGRMFTPGKHELIAGQIATGKFAHLEVGSQLNLRGTVWTVTGVFTTGGDSRESELLTDNATLLSAVRRGDYQSVTVSLASAQAFDEFKRSLAGNPALNVDAMRESAYFNQQSEDISKLVNLAAYVLGGIMGVGAIFAALNTMYSAVSARASEIAILRAIGYGGELIVLSVVIEALLLALLGSVVGVAITWLLLNGQDLNAGIGGSNAQLVFDVSVTPSLALTGVAVAAAIGVAGGFFPAISAARVPVTTALREI